MTSCSPVFNTDPNGAKTRSADLPDSLSIQPVELEHTGQWGRPRYIIDCTVLDISYSLRGSTELAQVFGVAPRTVRRRVIEAGIVEAGEPV